MKTRAPPKMNQPKSSLPTDFSGKKPLGSQSEFQSKASLFPDPTRLSVMQLQLSVLTTQNTELTAELVSLKRAQQNSEEDQSYSSKLISKLQKKLTKSTLPSR